MPLRRRWPASDTLDDLFLAHYAQMLAWAQLLVGHDRQAAEDLVHDTYVRVALRNPDVGTIRNVAGYLFVTLRNVHLSEVRREATSRAHTVSVVDYESAVASLQSLSRDGERQVACEELARIAQYACLRKPSSKAASALILRFFHGYYPSEVARVLQATEAGVAARLKMARREARAYVADPDRLRFLGEHPALYRLPVAGRSETDFILALRQAIFDARAGVCLSEVDLDHIYTSRASDPLDAATLSHLVSCSRCLDTVNRRLALPLLKDRDPSDMLGRGGRSGGGGTGSAGADVTKIVRTRLKDVLDDHPQELQIAVNGLFVGSQAVSGPVSEQRLKVLVAEQVGFVEVFNEHGTCLLYLDVEPPPVGPVEQSARVGLSDGRHLSATLAFHDASPTLQVVYEDVAFGSVPQPATARALVQTDRSPRHTWWNLRPVPLRFVLAGVVLGLLLANPSRTFAAVERVGSAIVRSILTLVERAFSRPALPSRSTLSMGRLVAPAARDTTPFDRAMTSSTPAIAHEPTDVGQGRNRTA